jgi:acylphosphatase
MPNHTRHFVIVGRVQGVGFRYAMMRKAADLGICGWVRNRSDGAVEAVVQGSPDAVARMMAWARHGPRAAEVERVEVEPGEGEFDRFEMRPTD